MDLTIINRNIFKWEQHISITRIPKTFTIVKFKYIAQLPNDHNEEIDSTVQQTVEFENGTYK